MSSNIVLGGGVSDNSQDVSELSQAPGPEFVALRPVLQETGCMALQQSPPGASGSAPAARRKRLEELQELVLERELRRIELEEKKLLVETQKLQLEKENLELEKQKLQLEIGELQSHLRHARPSSGY